VNWRLVNHQIDNAAVKRFSREHRNWISILSGGL
jgi:hypothetical protein